MAIPLLMPKIGLTMTEGKVIEWRKQPGQRVEKGEIVFVFETEKVAFDVEAPQGGFLARIVAEVEDTVPVGAVVGLLAEREGEQVEWKGEGGPVAAAPPGPVAPRAPAPAPERPRERVRASPMARRLAREKGVDLDALGAGGERVRSSDVAAAAAPGVAPPVAPPPRQAPAAEGTLQKLTGMRRTIAERMLAAKRDTAQAYMVASVDATGLLAARERHAAPVEREAGVHLTLTDLLLKVVATAVAAHPAVNARWTPEGILRLAQVHIGMALALDDGLVVPVLRDAAGRTLAQLAAERARLVEQGRAGKLPPDELRGSTVTLSSLGMFGVEEFSAILNPPESAILAVGAILDTPVARDKAVVVRPVMKVTLTYDHRVIDGAVAARFLKTFRELAEAPALAVG